MEWGYKNSYRLYCTLLYFKYFTELNQNREQLWGCHLGSVSLSCFKVSEVWMVALPTFLCADLHLVLFHPAGRCLNYSVNLLLSLTGIHFFFCWKGYIWFAITVGNTNVTCSHLKNVLKTINLKLSSITTINIKITYCITTIKMSCVSFHLPPCANDTLFMLKFAFSTLVRVKNFTFNKIRYILIATIFVCSNHYSTICACKIWIFSLNYKHNILHIFEHLSV